METIDCDVLVLGGGAAGSRAAYEAKRSDPKARVVLAVEGRYGASGSSTLVASESLGINAPFDFAGDGDDPDTYYRDIMETGGGLADPRLCRIIADESCARVEELMGLGLSFDSRGGQPLPRLLSGCTKARSLTCGGSTGLDMVRVLKQAGEELGVEAVEGVRAVALLKGDDGSVQGVSAIRKDGTEIVFRSGATILATGGAGRLFRKNINPPGQEGDGWAMAYESGAELVNMEFFQIGPAVVNQGVNFIIHSHMWRFQPELTNVKGEAFLAGYCPKGVSATEVLDAKAMSYPFSVRTIAKYLDIAVFKEIMAGRATANDGVFFDVRRIGEERLREKAPITYERLKTAGHDLAREKVELGLVVQNFNGGVRIDENGFCGVPGLYAAGEISGGVHGSDRPGGNNLTDTQVFGYRAGRAAAGYGLAVKGKSSLKPEAVPTSAKQPDPRESGIVREASDLFYRELTIVRDAKGLGKVKDFALENSSMGISRALRNRLLVGEIFAAAMLAREESRGTHYREDFPETSSSAGGRISVRRGADGRPTVSRAGVENTAGRKN